MKKYFLLILTIIILFITINAIGEEQSMKSTQEENLPALNKTEVENDLANLKMDQQKLKADIRGRYGRLLEEIELLKKTNASLNSQINAVRIDYAEQKKQYQEQLQYRTFYIVGLLAIIIVGILWTAIIVRKRLNHFNMLEKIIAQDNGLVSYLKGQLDIMNKSSTTTRNSDDSVQHTFPVRVASEIYRMRKRIESMDDSTRGLNALKNALNRLDDDLNQKGYTINDLSSSPYIDELTVKITNTIEREDLEPGSYIINRMIEPQILFNGVVVGHGEVELAVGVKK